jgi:hypothetical protein
MIRKVLQDLIDRLKPCSELLGLVELEDLAEELRLLLGQSAVVDWAFGSWYNGLSLSCSLYSSSCSSWLDGSFAGGLLARSHDEEHWGEGRAASTWTWSLEA